MKFKQYVENLVNHLKESPKSGDLDVVYAKDDEGNGYCTVNYDNLTMGHYDKDEREFQEAQEINAIVIN